MSTHLRVAALLAAFVLAAAACGGSDTAAEGGAATTPEEPPVTTEPAATAADTPSPAMTTEPPEETPATEPSPTEAMESTATEGEAMGGEATVAVASSDLGDILVDGQGMTLYLFTNDSPGESSCTGDCLGNWPALVIDGEPQAGEGADEALLGTIVREDDGSTQVTYNDWPLYYFAGDANPGDVNGQAIGDVWWVVTPEGEAVMGASATETETAGRDSGAY